VLFSRLLACRRREIGTSHDYRYLYEDTSTGVCSGYHPLQP
jgi:hypothetical protein